MPHGPVVKKKRCGGTSSECPMPRNPCPGLSSGVPSHRLTENQYRWLDLSPEGSGTTYVRSSLQYAPEEHFLSGGPSGKNWGSQLKFHPAAIGRSKTTTISFKDS